MGQAQRNRRDGGWTRGYITGSRVTYLLTLIVALLSIATGITSIVFQTAPFGPIAGYVPAWVQQLSGFTGTLTGFVMLASGFGLRRGLRAAWWSATLLVPLTATQGLIQSSEYSVPLIVLSVLNFVVLLVNRKRFDRELSLSTSQMAAGLALVGVQIYGTVGAFALREDFTGIDTLLDAFYFTLVTASTVGYGDATPTSQSARLFGMSLVVVGTASFGIALGALLGPAIEARFARTLGRMTESQLELLENHVLVLGYGELTEPILNELDTADVPFVVITPDQSRAAELADRGYRVITGDPSDEGPLSRGRVEDARAVVAATNNDAEDALAILTARQLHPDARIVVAATETENVEKLRRAGADTVISPASIGGHLLVQSALGQTDSEEIADKLLGGPLAAAEPSGDGATVSEATDRRADRDRDREQ